MIVRQVIVLTDPLWNINTMPQNEELLLDSGQNSNNLWETDRTWELYGIK